MPDNKFSDMANASLRQQLEEITPITDEEFAYIRSFFTPRTVRKHQFLVQENEAVLYDYFVVKGCFRAYFTDADAKEAILQFAMENWWVTDYRAYFQQEPATIHVDCLEAGEVLCLSLHNRETLCAEMPAVGHFFRKKSNAGYVALQKRILSLLTTNARQRYEQFVQQYPYLLQRIPKTLVAAYLGVSRETLSRFSVS